MDTQLIRQVRTVVVTDPIATAQPYDYADAFEVDLRGPVHDAPEAWVMAGMDQIPAWVEWFATLGGADEEWQVVESTEQLVRLEQSDPLMHNTLVGRNIGPSRRRITCVLRYKRPWAARLIWMVVGVIHRRAARYVITGDASAGSEQKEERSGRGS